MKGVDTTSEEPQQEPHADLADMQLYKAGHLQAGCSNLKSLKSIYSPAACPQPTRRPCACAASTKGPGDQTPQPSEPILKSKDKPNVLELAYESDRLKQVRRGVPPPLQTQLGTPAPPSARCCMLRAWKCKHKRVWTYYAKVSHPVWNVPRLGATCMAQTMQHSSLAATGGGLCCGCKAGAIITCAPLS